MLRGGEPAAAEDRGVVEVGGGEHHDAGLGELGALADAAIEGFRLFLGEADARDVAASHGARGEGREGELWRLRVLEHVVSVGAREIEAGLSIELRERSGACFEAFGGGRAGWTGPASPPEPSHVTERLAPRASVKGWNQRQAKTS